VGVDRLKLRANHTWRSKPGYSVCVLDRGAVRFDYPSSWVVDVAEGAVMLHDVAPCVESCDLGVSIFRLPGGAIAELPMEETLLHSLDTERKAYEQSEIRRVERGDLEIVWLEQKYVDAEYKREARMRVALARGPVICLISMNYWADRGGRLEPEWDEVLRTLVLGVYVSDPTAGPVVH
jgi:hypothetical protein